ncbi:MAG: winged helix-turn-helix domain-containing protein [Bdellovibrionota bacterium]
MLDRVISSESLEDRFLLGKLHGERGDTTSALKYLLPISDVYLKTRDFSNYLKTVNLLLRCYAELGQFDQIATLKDHLQELVIREGFELNSKTYYTLAVCATYKGQTDLALDYGQKALALALAQDNKEDINYAIYVIAACYSAPEVKKYSDALKEIYNLQVFFQFYDIPELRISTYILNADILRQLRKYDEAVNVCWKAYDEVRHSKSLILSLYVLVQLANIYVDANDREMARVYLSLAQRMVDPTNHIRLTNLIKGLADRIGHDYDQTFDLIFDETGHAVTERKLGKIDFKNQFILLDLLRLFVQNQGTVYSKEYLVENIWKQNYDPAVHDNKIYVTIKRLRKLIEPDYEKPKYIFRAKNGYYMNKSAKVVFEKH